MDGKLLPSVEFEKDLGLNVTENLQWDMPIKKICNWMDKAEVVYI